MQLLYNHYREHFATLDGRLAARAVDEVYCFHAAFRGEFRLHLAAVAPGAPASGIKLDAVLAQEEVEAPGAGPPPPPPPPLPPPLPADPGGGADAEPSEPEPGAHAGPSACGGVVFAGLPHGAVFRVVVEDDPRFAPKGPPPPIRFLGGGSSGAAGGVVERAGRGPAAAAAGGVGARTRGVAELTAELKGLPAEELSGERYKQLLEAREVEMALFSGGLGGE